MRSPSCIFSRTVEATYRKKTKRLLEYPIPPACVAADFNNDGFTDLYMTRAAWLSSGPNRMLKNDEGKRFVDVSEKGDATLAWQNSCGASALDFNQDGLLDLAVTGTSNGRLAILQNMGDFEFKDVSREVGIEKSNAITVGVATGDVNGDGWPDIFLNSMSPAPNSPQPQNSMALKFAYHQQRWHFHQ